jgi:molybdate transport system permease protein
LPRSSGSQLAYAGIRAHHVGFVESPASGGSRENVFPCWLAGTSETPFRITLYLHLHKPPSAGAAHHLQAEIPRERWPKLRDLPFPWHAQLPPESLLLLPE